VSGLHLGIPRSANGSESIKASNSYRLQNSSVYRSTGPTNYSLGTEQDGPVGRLYRVCWAYNASEIAEAVVDAGFVTIFGALPASAYVCTLGLRCVLQLLGHAGGAAGELRVLANGTNCSEARRPSGTLAMAQSAAGTAAYFFGLEFDLSASVYSLCWSLSQPDRLVDVHPSGTLTVAGVLPQNATCTLGTLCAVIFVESVQFVASGVALRSVEDNCGSEASFFTGLTSPARITSGTREFSFGTSTIGSLGEPLARMCWVHSNDGANVGDYRADVGWLSMRGPRANNLWSCTLGYACAITIEGTSVTGSASVRIFASGAVCGNLNVAPVFAALSTTASGALGVQELGTEPLGPPAQYVVCWGQDVQFVRDYSVPLGTLSLQGPTLLDAACDLGSPCEVQLVGVNISGLDGLTATSGACINLTVPVSESIAYARWDGSAWVYKLRAEILVAGPQNLCWGRDPTLNGFPLLIGTLTAEGVAIDTYFCNLGYACVLSLNTMVSSSTGEVNIRTLGRFCTEAQTSASILYDASGQQILPTSRRRTELDNAVLQASGLRVIQHPLGTPDGPGGRYRLC
jgi:hypothetical protein